MDGGLLLVHMCVSNCVSIVITTINIIIITTIINIIILSFIIVLTCDFASNSADAWSPPSRRLEICHLDFDDDDVDEDYDEDDDNDDDDDDDNGGNNYDDNDAMMGQESPSPIVRQACPAQGT